MGRKTYLVGENGKIKIKPDNIYRPIIIRVNVYKSGSCGYLELSPSLYNNVVTARYIGRLSSDQFSVYYNNDSVVLVTQSNSGMFVILEGSHVSLAEISSIDSLDGYTQLIISQ